MAELLRLKAEAMHGKGACPDQARENLRAASKTANDQSSRLLALRVSVDLAKLLDGTEDWRMKDQLPDEFGDLLSENADFPNAQRAFRLRTP